MELLIGLAILAIGLAWYYNGKKAPKVSESAEPVNDMRPAIPEVLVETTPVEEKPAEPAKAKKPAATKAPKAKVEKAPKEAKPKAPKKPRNLKVVK